MMSQGQGNNDLMTDLMVAIGAVIVIIIMIGFYYKKNAGPINYVLVEFNRVQLYALAHLPGSIGEETAYAYIKLGEKDPWDFTLPQIIDLFAYVGKYIRWIIIPILGGFIAWGFTSKHKVSDYYRRIFTMTSLIKNNVEEFPCMAPIANRKRSILEEPYDVGPWRTPRMAIQFVAENKLLLNKKGNPVATKYLIDRHGLPNLRSKIIKKDNNKSLTLDKEKATDLFMKQIGPKFTGIDDLPGYIKGLVAAFMAIGAGDKDAGFALLDHMSITFVEPDTEGDSFDISIKGADELIKKHKTNKDLAYHTNHHTAYLHPYMIALLEDHAKAKHGVLPSSRYIWLRPVNHLLFNILNQMGGREPWVEGAGAWTHYEAENVVEQSLNKPEVSNAVKGLEEKMIMTGWMAIPKDWQDA
ncbi:MAG: hypothetical protein GY710_26650 [Desulfobacteraceae bacterium]|nr:hypothetical protein [Desulfobacteraceae bacterium]